MTLRPDNADQRLTHRGTFEEIYVIHKNKKSAEVYLCKAQINSFEILISDKPCFFLLFWNYLFFYKENSHVLINQFTSGILYFFRSPRTGLFPVKILKKFLAINNFSGQWNEVLDKQINASFIDISRIK